MFKELILAIIFGGLIGFGATGTFIAIKKKGAIPPVNNPNPQVTTIPVSELDQITPTATVTTNNSPDHSSLTIFEPQNEAVVASPNITIKGQTNSSAVVIITTIDNSYSVNADSSGNFDISLNLNAGINHLKITSISPTDTESNTELFITYTTAKI